MKLVPVDHDPFTGSTDAASAARLLPVDHDPFADGGGQASGVASIARTISGGLIEGVPVLGPILRGGVERAAAFTRSVTGGKGYDEELKGIQDRAAREKTDRPWVDTGSQVVGGILGTLPMVAAAPAAFGAGAGGLVARSAASMGSGIALGAADSAVRSGGELSEIGKGALVGGGFGLMGPVAGMAIGAGVRKGAAALGARAATPRGMNAAAVEKLATDARNAGGTEAVRGRMAELGPESMLLDASPSFEGRAQGLAVLPDTRETVMRPLIERARGANVRLGADVAEHLGPSLDPAAFGGALDEAYAAAVPPLYRRALAQPLTVDTSDVLATIGRMGEHEKGGADQALRRAWGLLHTEGDVPGVGRAVIPDRRPEALHNAKEALDAMIAHVQAQQGSAAASELRALTAVRSGVNEALEAQVPGYREANRTAQHFFQQREAFDRGQTLLNGGREAVRPAQLAAETVEMTPEVAQAQRLGLRTEVDRLVGTKINDRVALQNAVQGEGDFNRARLGTVFGEEPTAGVVGAIERERAFDAAHRRIVDNSMTEMRKRAADEVAPREIKPGSGDLGTVVAGAAGGVKGAAIAQGVKAAKTALLAEGRARDMARNRQLAEAVTQRQGDELERLLAVIEARVRSEQGAYGIGRAAQVGTHAVASSQSERARPYVPFGFLPSR